MMVKFFVCLFSAMLIFSPKAYAVNNETDIYKEIAESGITDKIDENIDTETKKLFSKYGIDANDPMWTDKIEANNIFSVIADFIKTNGKKPFQTIIKALGIILLSALMQTFSPNASVSRNVQYLAVMVFSGSVGISLYSLISSVVSLMKSLSVFMTAFVPVMSGILAASGKTVSAAGISGVVLLAASMLGNTASFFIAPAMSSYIAMGICSGISENEGLKQFAVTFKKVIMWVFSFAVTVFLGILSIKGTVNGTADSVSVKTLKFILGSSVPVAGTALSETVSGVLQSITLLRKSVGMYAILALAFMCIPVIIEIMCYRITMFAVKSVSGILGCSVFGEISDIFDNMLSLLCGLLMLVFSLFVISLGILVSL